MKRLAGGQLIERATRLQPMLLRNAPLAEQQGELTAEVVDSLLQAEVWKMAVPQRWGGLCLSVACDGMRCGGTGEGVPVHGVGSGRDEFRRFDRPASCRIASEKSLARGVPRVCRRGSLHPVQRTRSRVAIESVADGRTARVPTTRTGPP